MSKKKRVQHILNQVDAILAAPEGLSSADWALLLVALCHTDRLRGERYLAQFIGAASIPVALPPVLGGVLGYYSSKYRTKAERAAFQQRFFEPAWQLHRQWVMQCEDEAAGLLVCRTDAGVAYYSPLVQGLYAWSVAGFISMDASAVTAEVAQYEVQVFETDHQLWSDAAGCYRNRDAVTMAELPTPVLEGFAPLLADIPSHDRAEAMLPTLLRTGEAAAFTADDCALLWMTVRGLNQYGMTDAAQAVKGWMSKALFSEKEPWKLTCLILSLL